MEKRKHNYVIVTYGEIHHKEHGIMGKLTAPSGSKAIFKIPESEDTFLANLKNAEYFVHAIEATDRLKEIDAKNLNKIS